jgi:hypothetical protein
MTDTRSIAATRLPIDRIDLTVLSLPLEPPFRAAIRTFDTVAQSPSHAA